MWWLRLEDRECIVPNIPFPPQELFQEPFLGTQEAVSQLEEQAMEEIWALLQLCVLFVLGQQCIWSSSPVEKASAYNFPTIVLRLLSCFFFIYYIKNLWQSGLNHDLRVLKSCSLIQPNAKGKTSSLKQNKKLMFDSIYLFIYTLSLSDFCLQYCVCVCVCVWTCITHVVGTRNCLDLPSFWGQIATSHNVNHKILGSRLDLRLESVSWKSK